MKNLNFNLSKTQNLKSTSQRYDLKFNYTQLDWLYKELYLQLDFPSVDQRQGNVKNTENIQFSKEEYQICFTFRIVILHHWQIYRKRKYIYDRCNCQSLS